MTCAERRDLLLLYAADTLEPAERESLRAHLAAGCPVCAGSLAEAEATLAQLAEAAPPVAPPPAALGKLMARVAADRSTSAAVPPMRPADAPVRDAAVTTTPTRPRSRSWLAAGLAAAAAVAVTSGIFLHATRDARTFWNSSDVATIALASETQPRARGQVWWDREHQQWRVSVTNLGPAPAGREYELWFIPQGGAPIASKTFRPDANGSASIVVDVPPNLTPVAVAAITDEPIGGLPAPTGKVHLAGNFR